MLVRILKSATLHGFGVFQSPYLNLEHVKTMGKQIVFVTCLHHARQPVRFLYEKRLVVESGPVFYTTLWAYFPRANRKTPRSISPIGHIPARAANQTRHAPSWHKQCAIRQVFTYVHCVHMRSAASCPNHSISAYHPPTGHSCYPGPAECAKRLNKY